MTNFACAASGRFQRQIRRCAIVFVAAVLANGTAVYAEDIAPPVCKGADMLAELAKSDPSAHAKIMQDAAKIENAEALLWKIEKAGTPVSYLFGTVHLSDTRVSVIPEKAKAALDTSKALAIEVADLNEQAMANAMVSSSQLLMYTDGHTLNEKLSPEEFKSVQEVLGKSGLPGEVAGMMRPWIVNMMMSVSDCERKKAASGSTVLDMNLAAEAKRIGIEVRGLETVEQQLAAMASVPDDQQIMMLKSGIKYAGRTDDMMETLIQLYLKRQVGAAILFQLHLAMQGGASPQIYDGLLKSLLNDRNLRMRDTLKPMLDKGSVFIGVGALHLPGKQGLVQLLKDEGYTLTAAE